MYCTTRSCLESLSQSATGISCGCSSGDVSFAQLAKALTKKGEPAEGKGECLGIAVKDKSDSLKPWRFERRPPGPRDVFIQVVYSGICHSDLHQVKDEWGGSIVCPSGSLLLPDLDQQIGKHTCRRPGIAPGLCCADRVLCACCLTELLVSQSSMPIQHAPVRLDYIQ